jgi:hypothetical protein
MASCTWQGTWHGTTVGFVGRGEKIQWTSRLRRPCTGDILWYYNHHLLHQEY